MGKTKSQSTTTNTYGWQAPPVTEAQTNYDNWANTAFDTPDPSIPYTFGNMRQNLNNRFDNPFGFNYSPEVAEANKYSQNNQIDQAQGQAHREDSFNRKNAKGAALAGSAAGHAPVLTQTGGSSTGSQSTNAMGIIGAGIGAAGQIGAAAM